MKKLYIIQGLDIQIDNFTIRYSYEEKYIH